MSSLTPAQQEERSNAEYGKNKNYPVALKT
jgi:hypothetical protein